jgi:hypothetical protein
VRRAGEGSVLCDGRSRSREPGSAGIILAGVQGYIVHQVVAAFGWCLAWVDGAHSDSTSEMRSSHSRRPLSSRMDPRVPS